MKRITLRWDYRKGQWRRIGYGWGDRYWIGRCLLCNAEWPLFNGRGLCQPCVPDHHHKLRGIRTPAIKAVNDAVQDGRLPKLDGSVPCVDCGKPARAYDHREYARPLDVSPVCLSCNSRRGPAKETAPLVVRRWNVSWRA